MGLEFYQDLADELRDDLESGVVQSEELRAYLRILEFLASCTEDDIYTLVDTNVFDTIIKANCMLAANDAGVSDETMAILKEAISFRLERHNSKEACEEYNAYRFRSEED